MRQRHTIRSEIREANKALAEVLQAWVRDIVLDSERFKGFHARGHHGEYQEFPRDTLVRQLSDLGWTPEQLKKLSSSATPLDMMSAEELLFALQRIQLMLNWFHEHEAGGGTYARACDMYEAVGSVVRNIVEKRTGHAPEQFSVEDVKITGEESPSRLTPKPYRASLFPMENE